MDTLSQFDGSLYLVAYKFFAQTTPLDGVQQFTIASAVNSSGTIYSFTTPTSVKPGVYAWQQQITQRSPVVMSVNRRGFITVQPNDGVTQTVTNAALMVTNLQNALQLFATSPDQSVSFNGQSYSRANIMEYQRQLAWFQAAVIKEQNALRALNGCAQFNRIAVQFVPADASGPYSFGPYPGPYPR